MARDERLSWAQKAQNRSGRPHSGLGPSRGIVKGTQESDDYDHDKVPARKAQDTYGGPACPGPFSPVNFWDGDDEPESCALCGGIAGWLCTKGCGAYCPPCVQIHRGHGPGARARSDSHRVSPTSRMGENLAAAMRPENTVTRDLDPSNGDIGLGAEQESPTGPVVTAGMLGLQWTKRAVVQRVLKWIDTSDSPSGALEEGFYGKRGEDVFAELEFSLRNSSGPAALAEENDTSTPVRLVHKLDSARSEVEVMDTKLKIERGKLKKGQHEKHRLQEELSEVENKLAVLQRARTRRAAVQEDVLKEQETTLAALVAEQEIGPDEVNIWQTRLQSEKEQVRTACEKADALEENYWQLEGNAIES